MWRRHDGLPRRCAGLTDTGAPAEGWVLVEFETDEEHADILSADLWSRGVVAVEEIAVSPGRTVLRTSLGADSDAAINEINATHSSVSRLVSFPSSVTDTWRAYAEPTHVSGDIWLVPAWLQGTGGRDIRIEPFDTFGLGNHPTTVLTLRDALPHTRPDLRVLDLGSGSGVLSVGIAALAGCFVDSHDIAPQAESALMHNAELNAVVHSVNWRGPLGPGDHERYGLVLANILAPVLRELAGDIQSATERKGTIVLSGLRTEQLDGVVSHYDLCSVESIDELDGWAGVTLRKA